MLSTDTWVWLIILGVLAIIIFLFGMWAYFFSKPTTPPCPDTMLKNDKGDCIGYKELKPDKSIKAPRMAPELAWFTESPGLSNHPWCTPTWYALRYVRASDGAYGPLGPWSPIDKPVVAGGKNLPSTNSFPNSCSYNSVSIGVNGRLEYDGYSPGVSDKDRIYANVHQQNGYYDYTAKEWKGFDPKSEGQIVGVLYPQNYNDYNWATTPLLDNPTRDQSTCRGC